MTATGTASDPGNIEYTGSNRHLSPQQFGGVAVSVDNEPDPLDGPLGSFAEPGPVGVGWQGVGVLARAGEGI